MALPDAAHSDAAAPPTIRHSVMAAARRFRDAGLETPGLDARLLVAHACGLHQSAIVSEPDQPITAAGARALESLILRRLAHEPVSRIRGCRQFYGLDLTIGPATLDPRPDTETLVDVVLELVRQNQVPGDVAPRILDLGTGSGAILIALLVELPAATGSGIDICQPAIDIAEVNARRHDVAARAHLHRSDWLDAVTGQFDLVVSNPPYIPRDKIRTLDPDVAIYDPAAALDGGPDGLDAYRIIASSVRRVLAPGGWLILEIGEGQADAVAQLCRNAGLTDSIYLHGVRQDLAGRARCVAVKARR